jgi:hypothetical protein
LEEALDLSSDRLLNNNNNNTLNLDNQYTKIRDTMNLKGYI